MLVLKTSEDYELSVQTGNNDRLYYSIINLKTGVEELGEDKNLLLPQAYDYMDQMQSHLDARRHEEAHVVSNTLNG